MENLPSTIPANFLMKSKYGDDTQHDKMSTSNMFLPRVQLMQGISKLVTRSKAKIGTYILVKGKDNIVSDFGDTFNCIVLSWRPKAVLPQGDSAKIFYNPSSPGFKMVEKMADDKTLQKKPMYGPEYLIYIPSVKELATFHFSSVTMRSRAGEMKALMGSAATLRTEFIESKGYSWHGPVISGCSSLTGMPEDGSDEQRMLFDRFQAASQGFCNPPDEMQGTEDGAEKVEEPASGDRPR